MAKQGGVVNIGLQITDYEKSIENMVSSFRQAMTQISNNMKKTDWSSKMESDISDLNKRIDSIPNEFKKMINEINSQKLNASNFNEYQNDIEKRFDAISQKISGVENDIKVLNKRLGQLDGVNVASKMSKQFEDLRDNILSTCGGLEQVLGLIESSGSGSGKSKLGDSLIKDCKETIEHIKRVQKEADNLDFDKSMSNDSLGKNLEKHYKYLEDNIEGYRKLKAEVKGMSKDDEGYTRKRNELYRYTASMYEAYDALSKLKEIQTNRNDGFEVIDKSSKLMASLENLDGMASKDSLFTKWLNDLQKMVQESKEATDQIQGTFDTFKVKNGAIHIPIDIATKNTQLKRQLNKIINDIQDYAKSKPIIAKVKLTLDGGSSKVYKNKAEMTAQQELGQKDPAIDISKSIENTYVKAAREAEAAVKSSIKKIQEEVKAVKIPIKPDSEAFINDLTAMVNSTLEKISKEGFKLNINDEISKLVESLKEVSTSFAGNEGFKFGLDEASISRITSAIEGMANMIQRAFKVASDSDIAQQWMAIESKFKSVAGEEGKLLKGNKEHKVAIQELAAEYKRYLDMGGKNDLSVLTNHKQTVKNITQEYENLSRAVQEASEKQEKQATKAKSSNANSEAVKATTRANRSLETQADKTSIAIKNEGKSAETAAGKFRKLAKEKGTAVVANRELAKAARETADALEKEAKARKESSASKNAVGEDVYSANALNWQNSIQQSLLSSGNYEEVVGSKISRSSKGIVQFTAYLRDHNNEWKKLTATVDEYGSINSPKIQDTTKKKAMQLDKDLEAAKKLREAMAAVDEEGLGRQSYKKSELEGFVSKIIEATQALEELNTKYKVVLNNDGSLSITKEVKEANGEVKTFTANFDNVNAVIDATKGVVKDLGQVLESAFDSGKFSQSTSNDIASRYKEVYDTAKALSALEVKISGLDSSKNANQVRELNQQYESLQDTYNRLVHSLVQDINFRGLPAEDVKKLNGLFEETAKKIAEIKAKLEDAKNSVRNGFSDKAATAFSDFERAWKNDADFGLIEGELDALREKFANIGDADGLKNLKQELSDLGAKLRNLKADAKLGEILGDGKTFSDINELKNSLSSLLATMGNVNAKTIKPKGLDKLEVEVEDANGTIRKLIISLDSIGRARFAEGVSREFGRLQKNAARILGGIRSLVRIYLSPHDFVRYFRQGLDKVKEIDVAMTELRKVSDATASELASYFDDATESAKKLGSSVKDMISATADWSRAGYDLPDAKKLGELAVLYKNVGDGIDIEEANSSLVSTLQGFQIEAEDASKIIDAFNEVSNNFAISSGGIGEALKRSAAAFHAANTDLNKSIALITTGNEIVQSPEKVGTMWQTVSARIRGTKSELEELGEETDSILSTPKLRELVKGYTGVDIMKDKDTYKDIYTIVSEIGKVWKDLEDLERAALLEALAGKKQSNTLAAVLNNADRLEEAYQTAEASAGSAMREQEKYAESIQYSLDQLTAHAEEFWASFLNTESVKGFIDILNGVLSKLTAISEVMGIVPVLAGVIATVLFASFVTVSKGVDGLNIKLSITNALLGGLPVIVGIVTSLAVGLIGWGVAAADTTKQVEKLTNKINEQQEAIDELTKKEKDVTDLYKEYNALMTKSNAYGLTAEEKESLLKISKDLVETYGLEVQGIDAVTGAYVIGTNAINDYVEALRKERNAKLEEQTDTRDKRIKNNIKKAKSLQQTSGTYESDIKNYEEYNSKFKDIIKEYQDIDQSKMSVSEKSSLYQVLSQNLQNRAKSLGIGQDIANSVLRYLTNSDMSSDLAKTSVELNGVVNSIARDLLDNIKVDNADILDSSSESLLTQMLTPHLTTVDWDTFDKSDFEAKVKKFVAGASNGLREVAAKLQDDQSKVMSGEMNLSGYEGMYSNLQNKAGLLKQMLDQKIISEDSYKNQVSQIYSQVADNIGLSMVEISSKISETDEASLENFKNIASSFVDLENQFKRGTISSVEYFEKLTEAIGNIDFAKTFGENTAAAQQFFSTLANKSANIVQNAIAQFEAGNISVKEYGDSLKSFAQQQKELASNAIEEAEALGMSEDALKELNDEYEANSAAIDEAVKKWEELDSINDYLDKNIETLRTTTNVTSQTYQNFASGLYSEFTKLSDNMQSQIISDMQEMEGLGHITAENLKSEMGKSTSASAGLATAVAKNTNGVFKNLATNGGKVLSKLGEAIKNFKYTITFNPNAKFSGGEFDIVKWAKSGAKEGIKLPSMSWDITGKPGGGAEGLGDALVDLGNSLTVASDFIDVSDYGSGSGDGNYKPPYTPPTDKDKDKGDKNKPDYQDPTDAIINRINLKATELKQEEKSIQNALELAKIEKDYGKQIEESTNLLDKRKERLNELTKPGGAQALLLNEIEYLKNSTPQWDEDTWFNSQGEATEAYYALYNSTTDPEEQKKIKTQFDTLSKYKKAHLANEDEIAELEKQIFQDEKVTLPQLWEEYTDDEISDIEHNIDLRNTLGEKDFDADIRDNEKKHRIASARAQAWRDAGYDENSEEVQKWDKIDAETISNIQDTYEAQIDSAVSNIQYGIEIRNTLGDRDFDANIADYKEIQRIAHERAEAWRAAGYSESSEEIQKWQKVWMDAETSIWEENRQQFDERLQLSEDYIQHSINFGWENGDNEIAARKRILEWIQSDYYRALIKDDEEYYRILEENRLNYHNAIKDEFGKANNLANSYLDSQKSILQSQFDVENSIAEARHEINKELETSKTMYEYLDEDTRKLLFNQEDYNTLWRELNEIEDKSLRLQSEYEDKIANATLETVESITSEYQMQYETLMKSYEIAKAELDVAKKKQKLNNVLNERNVRMFINGSWQWVANTEDVANAKSELADAKYAEQVARAGLTQQKSIDDLTRKQNELGVVIKKFENGVIDLSEAVRLAKEAIGDMPNALYSSYSKVKSSNLYSSSVSNSSGGSSGGSSSKYSSLTLASVTIPGSSNKDSVFIDGSGSVTDPNLPMGTVVHTDGGDYQIVPKGTEGAKYNKGSGYYSIKLDEKDADGTRYTLGGLTLMGEEGSETYITANGRLIPIEQPTIGNIPSGGVVFNTEQMKNLRTLWDMSNFNLNTDKSYVNKQPQQIDQSQDNRIIINGMTVDSGSADGQALISALRRYVGNH